MAAIICSTADDKNQTPGKSDHCHGNRCMHQSVIKPVPNTRPQINFRGNFSHRTNTTGYFLQLLQVLLCVVSMATADPTWKQPPQDMSIPLATRSVTLTCGVNNLPESSAIIWTLYEDDGGSTTIFVNDIYMGSPSWPEKDRYTVIAHPQRSGYGYDLVISEISHYDDRMFECQVGNSELRGKAEITVLGELKILFFYLLKC